MKYKSVGFRIFYVFNLMLMIFASVSFLYPIINVLARALNEGSDTAFGGITIYPRYPTLENFQTLFSNSTIPMAASVSFLRVFFGTLFSMIVTFFAGYALTKKSFMGKTAIQVFLIVPMFISGGLIPTYLLYSKLHLIDNFLVYILPGAFSFYSAAIIRVYINENIPDSLREAARLDGANEILIFFKIIVPLSMPIVAVIALWNAVGAWNDWTTTLYYVTDKKLYTLQYVLMMVLKQSERLQQFILQAVKEGKYLDPKTMPKTTPESIQCAQIIITILPIVCVYPFAQKYFIKGAVIGALKE